jgi:hypothetical protein
METLDQKQAEFVAAMERYEGESGYARFGHFVAAGNVVLQLTLLVFALTADISWIWHVLLFGAAYLVADFINGFAHLLMDNCVRYQGVLGPSSRIFICTTCGSATSSVRCTPFITSKADRKYGCWLFSHSRWP